MNLSVCYDCYKDGLDSYREIYYWTPQPLYSSQCEFCNRACSSLLWLPSTKRLLFVMRERERERKSEAQSIIDTWRKKCELLENHIKYQPGGEGALEALCSFSQHLQEGGINAEESVHSDSEDE